MWSKGELEMLSGMVGAVNCFGLDVDDEIQVRREDNSAQGILKTWAAPFIAFLDSGKLGLLSQVWGRLLQEAKLGRSFEQALSSLPTDVSEEISTTIDRWNGLCRSSPDYFRRSLYRALNNSYLLDAALLRYYETEVFGGDPKSQLLGNLARFKTAVGLLGPFYHIEALVANEDSRWSLLGNLQDEVWGGGELDALVFLLPAIFADGEDIDDIEALYLSCQTRAAEILASTNPRSALLWRIVKAFGVSPVDVLLASELLNKIPVRVGGKKEDFDFGQATTRANELLASMTQTDSTTKVARDINAEIRFHNWMVIFGIYGLYQPQYESICGPAKEMERIMQEHPEFWTTAFRQTFASEIADQLADLDAQSAKGRLLYSLIVEEQLLSAEFYPLELPKIEIGSLDLYPTVVTLGQATTSRRLFGDKAANLGVLSCIGQIKDSFIPGFVLPTTSVEQMFFASDQTRKLLSELVNEDLSLAERLRIGKSITAILQDTDTASLQELLDRFLNESGLVAERSWAVRSSCFGEDDPENPSAGIYKSVLGVASDDLARAATAPVSSWFSEAAITHRYLVGQSDLPLVAIVLQPYLEGKGGVVEVRDDPELITVHTGESAAAITGGEVGREARFQFNELIGDTLEVKVATLAQQLYGIFGELDLEWVSVDDRVKILQLKTYKQGGKTPKLIQRWVEYDINSSGMLERLQSIDEVFGLSLKGEVNLEAFQGELFGHIARLGPKIGAIALEKPIPRACHFANICSSYGIALMVANEI